MRIAQLKEGSVDRDAALFGKKPLDRLDALDHPITLRRRLDSEHVRVGRERAGTASEDDAPTGDLIEHRETVRDIERMVIRHADDARSQHDPLGACGSDGHEDLRRRDNLPSGGVMLADKGFIEAEFIEPFDQFQVALEGERGIFADPMERGHEDAEFHAVSSWCA